jgi:anaerobic selenocysteine-containing dehydrogenase
VVFTGCQPARREHLAQSRVRLAEDVLSAYDDWYATTCRQCPAGCGVIVRVVEGRAKKIEGNPDHPLNRGKLCARGQAGVQEQYHPDRLQGPLRRAGGRGMAGFNPISWDTALNDLGGRLRSLVQQGRGDQIVLITPPLRAHQAMLVERFTSALGAQWMVLDLIGEEPLREAARRVFGQDALPVFDIQNAQYILSFGADFLHTWLSPVHYGIQYGIFRQGDYSAGHFEPRQGRPRGHLVQIEPRFSGTAASADEWIPIRPGGERLLALSLMQVLLSERMATAAGRAQGSFLPEYEPERAAAEIGIPAERIRQLARDFATNQPSLAIGGGPASAHTKGADTLGAILFLNALVGTSAVRLDPPAAIEGLPTSRKRPAKLVDWQQLVERLRGGQIQAVLVHDANPVYSLPAALGFREALPMSAFTASFSSFANETAILADLVLPSHLPLEDWGDDVPEPGLGFPVLTIQQPILRPLYDTRSFWDVLLSVARQIGEPVSQSLPWLSFKDVLRDGARSLQRSGSGSQREPEFERSWTSLLQQGGWWEMAPTPAPPPNLGEGQGWGPIQAAFAGSEQDFPFHLLPFKHNTLGGGETAHLPWLQAAPDPVTSVVWQTWVEVNPRVAAEQGLKEGDVVAVVSPHGRIEVPVYINPAARPDVLAIPLGQGHSGFGRWADKRGANPLDLLAPLADEATGALAYAATRVRLERTGRSITMPKLEGTADARQLPELEVVKVTKEMEK